MTRNSGGGNPGGRDFAALSMGGLADAALSKSRVSMEKDCPFCSPPADEIVLRHELCYARYDKYPVSPGHVLIIPFRHVAGFFDLTTEEQQAAWELVFQMKERLVQERRPDGFNVGINVGERAGQTVMHVHIHLIPRYRGDMQNPEGGVRGVIPELQAYKKQQ